MKIKIRASFRIFCRKSIIAFLSDDQVSMSRFKIAELIIDIDTTCHVLIPVSEALLLVSVFTLLFTLISVVCYICVPSHVTW